MTQVGSVYGQALYELAASESLSDEMLCQIQTLLSIFQSEPDFIKLLSSPTVSKQERTTILDETFRSRIHLYLLNFLKILTEKSYIKYFEDCCHQYTQLYNHDHNILSVSAKTAVALNDTQKSALIQKLSRITGKTINLSNPVDPTCLGGVRLDYDGQRLDGTVRKDLESIRNLLQNTVL